MSSARGELPRVSGRVIHHPHKVHVRRLEPINAFTPEQTEWVIPGWLASGEFHLLAGQAGMGKSTLAMKVAAMVSRSQDFNGDPCAGGDVVLWSGEDHYTKTLLPRLLVNGADPGHRQICVVGQ